MTYITGPQGVLKSEIVPYMPGLSHETCHALVKQAVLRGRHHKALCFDFQDLDSDSED